MAGGTATVLMGGCWTRAERLSISSRLAKLTKSQRLMTLWRLYVYETLLKRLTQPFQDVASELRQLIQEEHAVVRQRHLARHGEVPAADQTMPGVDATRMVGRAQLRWR